MPLHLLGKKSWNVYNAENIARVKQDEAAAAAREEAEELRIQEVDAEHRMHLLRGIRSQTKDKIEERARKRSQTPEYINEVNDSRKRKRKLPGEDDTDRDLRLAAETKRQQYQQSRSPVKRSNAPLLDETGHISLFPEERRRNEGRNTEKLIEEKKKRMDIEDQYTLRFANATGHKNDILESPWYASRDQARNNEVDSRGPSDARNSVDSRWKEKSEATIATEDPLTLMRRGIRGVRQLNRDRRVWKQERSREIEALVSAEKAEVLKPREHNHKKTHASRHHSNHNRFSHFSGSSMSQTR